MALLMRSTSSGRHAIVDPQAAKQAARTARGGGLAGQLAGQLARHRGRHTVPVWAVWRRSRLLRRLVAAARWSLRHRVALAYGLVAVICAAATGTLVASAVLTWQEGDRVTAAGLGGTAVGAATLTLLMAVLTIWPQHRPPYRIAMREW